MSLGKDPFDVLAHDLTETDFDAVERGTLRAEWSEDGTYVEVTDEETDERVLYTAEDLVRAASDREVQDAREPDAVE